MNCTECARARAVFAVIEIPSGRQIAVACKGCAPMCTLAGALTIRTLSESREDA